MELIPGKTLYKYTRDLLGQAIDCGFPGFQENLELNDEKQYCVMVCAAIAQWLRSYHLFDTWVIPFEANSGHYMGVAQQVDISSIFKRNGAVMGSYELANISILTDIVNIIPVINWFNTNYNK
jgi:hypothetical protein